jgi:hypothetical protein
MSPAISIITLRRPSVVARMISLGAPCVSENLARVVRRVHFGIGCGDFPLLVDEIADAHRVTCPHVRTGTISQTDFVIRIAQQSKWELVFGCKRGIRGDIIKADTENHDAGALENTIQVAEPATLAGSARCIGLGVEPQKNLAAAQ